MDTSNSQGRFRINDLLRSEYPEDRELATKTIGTVVAIVVELKPILRYVVDRVTYVKEDLNFCKTPGTWAAGETTKAVRLLVMTADRDYPRVVFLKEDGNFFAVTACPHRDHYHGFVADREYSWGAVFFDELLTALQKVLTDAKQKREQHLESIAARSAMLDRIVEAMKGSS